MKPDREILLAAIDALENKAIMAVLDYLEKDAIAQWQATDLSDASSREIFYLQQLAVQQLRQTLINWSRDTKR